MPSRNELIRKRREAFLAQGFKPSIVELAMEWASGCAEGMANYVTKQGEGDSGLEELTVRFLPRYLDDSERWMRSFGHEPKKVA